ncbi:MAG: aminotransferase DegT [Planctomycetaceae bacterium]|nr:aminotransferase DegT [Planctomycetaceae bacterium]
MIPLLTPNICGNEWQYVRECLDTEWVSTAGEFVELFEQKITDFTGAKYAIACINGTSALQVSLRIAGVEPHDEVIVPTLTFIAPINAIHYNYARPIFFDVDCHYNIDVGKVSSFLEKETFFQKGFTYNRKTGRRISAIIPVHMWGNAVDIASLVSLCQEYNIEIVEDASESLGTYYLNGKFEGRHSGTLGELGCISFNANKIITTGGGGMIITNDIKLAEEAHYLTTQAKDDPVKYIHNEVGYNFRLTNIQAALGLAQMEQLPKFLKRKKEIYDQYTEGIKEIVGLEMAAVPDYSQNNHWLNLLQIDSKAYGFSAEILLEKLKKRGIQTRPVWKLNHLQKPYRKCQSYKIETATKLQNNSLCLPSSTKLTRNELQIIIKNLSNNESE